MQPNPALIQRLRTAARVAGYLVLLIGALALAGWILGVEQLKSVVPGVVTMKTNTALCLVVAGPALAILARPGSSSRAVLAARIGAGLVGVLALLVLSEYISGRNLGIDQLLFPEHAHATGTAYPNRMAVNSAVAFVLWSLAVQLLDAP